MPLTFAMVRIIERILAERLVHADVRVHRAGDTYAITVLVDPEGDVDAQEIDRVARPCGMRVVAVPNDLFDEFLLVEDV